MDVKKLDEILDSQFYVGVPDSQLKALCDYLMNKYGIGNEHMIAANEGNAVALAAGYYLATGKTPVVYMQNSGIGNIINPVASLLNDKVYAIPCIFIVGWRGEPGVHDEPQHIFQGEVTETLIKDMGISSYVIDKETTDEDIFMAMSGFRAELDKGKNVAFIIKKGALINADKVIYKNDNEMNREDIIKYIAEIAEGSPIISTTGKASRELFEIREKNNQSHKYDFLTVGSMGHTSSIALKVAMEKKNTKVWCIDGDGAALMHMGALAVIGSNRPKNLIHIVINNGAHETVGGMPTVASDIDFVMIAKGCGYPKAVSVDSFEQLDMELVAAKERNELSLIEVKCSIGARADLGRPTTTAIENKKAFMKYLEGLM